LNGTKNYISKKMYLSIKLYKIKKSGNSLKILENLSSFTFTALGRKLNANISLIDLW